MPDSEDWSPVVRARGFSILWAIAGRSLPSVHFGSREGEKKMKPDLYINAGLMNQVREFSAKTGMSISLCLHDAVWDWLNQRAPQILHQKHLAPLGEDTGFTLFWHKANRTAAQYRAEHPGEDTLECYPAAVLWNQQNGEDYGTMKAEAKRFNKTPEQYANDVLQPKIEKLQITYKPR